MNAQLNEIVESNYCRYDLHSACAKGENDSISCTKCIADSASEIVRF
jgi:hypothetical protein